MSNVTSICGTPRGAGGMPPSYRKIILKIIKNLNFGQQKTEIL